MQHLTVPATWATWSHGFTGDVYAPPGSSSVTLLMPRNTGAFYFYAQPEGGGATEPPFRITATAFSIDVTTAYAESPTYAPVREVDPNGGAQYFGFYTSGNSDLYRIDVFSNTHIAVGEFAIAAGPHPGWLDPDVCFGALATITGDGVVNGTPGDDVIVTGNGDDIVDGKGGNDRICSRGGEDHVRGGTGSDRINSGNGNDDTGGQAGNDLVQSTGGNDDVQGGDGDDRVQGGDGDDTLNGGDGADRVEGEDGNDLVAGNAGAPDTCDGGDGTDTTIANDGCEITTNIP